MSTPTRIAVLGAGGKMGRAIVRIVAGTPGAALGGAFEPAGSATLGQDAGVLAGAASLGVPVQAGLPAAGAADVWIDFTVPAASVAAARAAAAAKTAIVIGTTGLDATERAAIGAAAREIPIVFTPNMSVGVNVLLKLVADAARALGPGYDLEIVETHHRAKRDAPSGTALRLAQAAADGAGRDLGAVARYARHGEIGPRPHGEIGIQALRGGDVVGDHTVFFLGDGERIEITHRASSRDTFAQGAVRAALWVVGRAPGLYDMRAVLGL
jgi:4-hydroxy-tetrahydrodipicolinate reductase